MSIEWLKLFHHLPEDRKLLSFSINQKWAWICLLCAASQSSERGTIVDDQDDMAVYCGFPNVQDYQFFLDKLRQKGMIEPIGGGFKIHNWEKRQYVKPSDASEATRERKRKQRAKPRDSSDEVSRDVTPMSRPCHATDTDTDTDPETYSEPDPEAKQDPEREDARRAVQVCDQNFDFPEQPTATKQKSQLTANQPQTTPEQNPSQEITAIPQRITAENDQQGTLTLSRDEMLMQQKRAALQGRIEADPREALISEAIATYNQFRGSWGKCPEDLPEGYRNRLYQIFYRQKAVDKREAFLALIRDATLWVARSQYHTKPDFGNKNFLFLIGQYQNEKIAEFAAKWRSLPEESKVGAAIKISQPKEKVYCDLRGKETKYSWARIDWWDLNKKALNGEEIPESSQAWAKYYFPNNSIYEKTEELI